MISDKQIQEESQIAYDLKKQELEFVRDNLTEEKNCKTCEHIGSCTLELLEDNIKPSDFVCSNFSNFEKQQKEVKQDGTD